jgi:hypothetical protein
MVRRSWLVLAGEGWAEKVNFSFLVLYIGYTFW